MIKDTGTSGRQYPGVIIIKDTGTGGRQYPGGHND